MLIFRTLSGHQGPVPTPVYLFCCAYVCVCGRGVGDVVVHLRLDRYCFKVRITYISIARKQGLRWHSRQVLGMRNQYTRNSHKFISASHLCSCITRPSLPHYSERVQGSINKGRKRDQDFMSYVIFVADIIFLAWCEMSKEIGDSLKVRKQGVVNTN